MNVFEDALLAELRGYVDGGRRRPRRRMRWGAAVAAVSGALALGVSATVLVSSLSSEPHKSVAKSPQTRSGGIASLAYAYTSFAQVRANSTAIVEVVAGSPASSSKSGGVMAGAPLARTPVTVTKIVWGHLDSRAVTVVQSLHFEFDTTPLVEGARYLLFLMPTRTTDYAGDGYWITGGVGYRLSGDSYTLNGDRIHDLPTALPVQTAEQQVLGGGECVRVPPGSHVPTRQSPIGLLCKE